jgi:thiol-disulfide isomerase/thioredoxin
MSLIGYVAPEFNRKSFTCPHCNCFSLQEWRYIVLHDGGYENLDSWCASWCLHCKKYCFWNNTELAWPIKSGVPDSIEGCPASVKDVYNEARTIFPFSPRASAALLRLAIQLVCKEKGLPAENLNHDIGELVKSGLSEQIQQSLDLLRVVGNNAVHPGQIEIEENKDQIASFFGLVNLIVDVLIVQPKKINTMFSALVPSGQQKQITARDGKA